MDQSTVRMMCPNLSCRQMLGVPAAMRGKTVRCRRCGTFLHVPASPMQPPAQPSSTPPLHRS